MYKGQLWLNCLRFPSVICLIQIYLKYDMCYFSNHTANHESSGIECRTKKKLNQHHKKKNTTLTQVIQYCHINTHTHFAHVTSHALSLQPIKRASRSLVSVCVCAGAHEQSILFPRHDDSNRHNSRAQRRPLPPPPPPSPAATPTSHPSKPKPPAYARRPSGRINVLQRVSHSRNEMLT